MINAEKNKLDKFSRLCPNCFKIIKSVSASNNSKAIKNKQVCRECSINKLKKKYLGQGNPFYGKKHTIDNIKRFKVKNITHVKEKWFRELRSKQMTINNPVKGKSNYQLIYEKYGKEEADRRKRITVKKISIATSGKNNPMYGRLSPNGSGIGWKGWYNNLFFRSLRELSYIIYLEENNIPYISAESKDFTIDYINYDGKYRTYRPDFLINNKILIEIKPKKLFKTKSVKLKAKAARKFCKSRNLKYQLVDPIQLTDKQIMKLYLDKKIKFTDIYEEKFKEKYL